MAKHLRILLIFLILIFSVALPCSAKDLKKGSISGVLDWAKKTCEDPKVKYIWGGSHGAKSHEGEYTGYDCSGFVYWALKEGGGFDVDSAGGPFITYTNEPTVLNNLGFEAGDLSKGWKAGDVFVSHDHTMLAAKDGKGDSAAVYHDACADHFGTLTESNSNHVPISPMAIIEALRNINEPSNKKVMYHLIDKSSDKK